ncbi:MAG: HAMP domain-containing histidine kinase [Thermomicrobiales bacterium]|nr:MAG: HAMP domain-containing histidine kinase [Thermomicrobiales bacterium]
MYILRYNSLRKRLVLPFGLLGLFVSALLSAITFVLVSDIEQHAIERVLKTEIESFRNRKAQNPSALPPSATLIQGDFLPSGQFPSVVQQSGGRAEEFQRREINGRDFEILVGDIGGRPYALLYDRTVTNAGLADLAWALVAGTLFMCGLSALVGHYLAGQVVRPIRRLLDDISEKAALVGALRESPLRFSAEQFPDNEIGQLVRALDQFAQRLQGFVLRESYFSADVSHELRTPVAVIRGATEVMIEHPEISGPVLERLKTIHRQAVRMGEILEAMLLLSREDQQIGDPACSIAGVVEEAMADCASLIDGREVKLVLEPGERPIVAVERSLAYVVISNLLRNACAHTRTGSISVRLSADTLEIRDTGIGIPEDRFSEIFKRYVKGEHSSGSGLGLSIVARIAHRISWKIDVDSGPGIGTKVIVAFVDPESRQRLGAD